MSDYGLWQHETGVDEVDGNTFNAIYSFFETGNLSLIPQGKNRNLQTIMIEPDFVQSGEMTLRITGRNNARADQLVGPALPFGPTTELIHPKNTRRYLQLKFESNVAGGNYLTGTPVIHMKDSDGRSST